MLDICPTSSKPWGRERGRIPARFTTFIGKNAVDDLSLTELRATLIEISASAAVMQAEIRALVSTHPNLGALRSVFLQEIEKHTARSLALAVPDELPERIQTLAGKALKEMAGGDCQQPAAANSAAVG